jgi:2-oxoglutarate dehydrogenase E1 component
MAKGSFQGVIDDATASVKEVDTVVFCSGKFYYDLLAKQEEIGSADNLAIVRVEQLYPLPQIQLDKVTAKYKNAKNYIWTQEEPENMGAWSHMMRHFTSVDLKQITLAESGASATGSSKAHAVRHADILDRVFKYALVKN